MKIAVYVGPPMTRAIEAFQNRSRRVNDLCERYMAMVEDACPALTVDEWRMLLEQLGGVRRDVAGARRLWLELSMAPLDDAEEAVIAGLIPRLKAATLTERLAILEMLDRYWEGHPHPGKGGYGELLKRLGARVKED
jgi:hypothetical protein